MLALNDNPAARVNAIITGLVVFFFILFCGFFISLLLNFFANIARIAESLEQLSDKK